MTKRLLLCLIFAFVMPALAQADDDDENRWGGGQTSTIDDNNTHDGYDQ